MESIASRKDDAMRNFDLSPLYRATIGFDQLAELMDREIASGVSHSGYPPYNIEKSGEDSYRISIAVAGFGDDDMSVEVRDRVLSVTARKSDDGKDRTYLHRGIANRGFERRFHLADHVQVTSATQENGMLHIDLQRQIPEALKPRRIEIAQTGKKAPEVVQQAVAAS